MEINFYWAPLVEGSLEVRPSVDGLTDVVVSINYQRVGSNQDNSIYAVSVGQVGCPSPSPTDFTAYADLTEEQVFSWLDQLVDVPAVDAIIMEEILTPKVVTLPLPW
jgi:hypothetical protein